MNKTLIRKLYFEATAACEQLGSNDAWIFETKFAELIVKECAAVVERVKNNGSIPRGVHVEDHFL